MLIITICDYLHGLTRSLLLLAQAGKNFSTALHAPTKGATAVIF